MNSEELLQLRRRLEVMKRRGDSADPDVPGDGDAPGFSAEEIAELWSLDLSSDVFGDGSFRAVASGAEVVSAVSGGGHVRSQASSTSTAPTIAEFQDAVHVDVDSMTGEQCLRALVKQNNVLIRDAMCRQRRPVRQRSDGGVVVGPSGSFGGSLLALVSSSGDSSLVSSSATTSGSCNSPGVKQSPPRSFVCPCCKKPKNEKSFDRHVKGWIEKIGREQWRSGQCRGIQDIHHPLLSTFKAGSLEDRVRCVVRDIRSLLHPGAYDANSPGGSGRHVAVAARLVALGYTG